MKGIRHILEQTAMSYSCLTRRFYHSKSRHFSLYDVFFSPGDIYWWKRYRAVADVLARWNCKTILDVGSGHMGIWHFIDNADIVALDKVPPKRADVKFVPGNAMHLPFPDKSFDVVISVAMLPQIRQQDRDKVLSELQRVGKRVVVYSESVEDADMFMGNKWERVFYIGRSRANWDYINSRQVALIEVTKHLPHYFGVHNWQLTMRYLKRDRNPLLWPFNRLWYWYTGQYKDNRPPFKSVVAYGGG